MKALGALAGAGIVVPSSACSGRQIQQGKDILDDARFFVSVDGDDRWSGASPAANGDASDGPFATLARARDAVRELKRSVPNEHIAVIVRGGFYRLDETVVFGLDDSGSDNATVTYAAYPGEIPVFSSGYEISGWERAPVELPGLPSEARGKVWTADVSQRFRTLFDADGMLPRARSTGFVPLPGGSRSLLHFPEGRLKNWSNLEDVEVVVRPHHAWIVNVLPLQSVDEKSQLARTSIDATYAMNELHFLKGTESCWVENVLEELNSPGEWVLNSRDQKLYLWARDGKRPQGILAPRLHELIRVEGAIDKSGAEDTPVRNLRFCGLTFMHGERYQLSEQDAGLQHDWDMHDKGNALVRLRGAEACKVEDCHFVHSGGGAIRLDLHAQNNSISGNHVEQLGGAGILLSGYGPGTKNVNRKNLVYNNHIHHIGKVYSHSPALMIWQSGENRIANNLIHHTPYTGIIISGCMTEFFNRPIQRELARTIRWHEVEGRPGEQSPEQVRSYLHTRDNAIEQNDIHHAMEQLGDGNGIYIRGAGPGNVIRQNYVHHLVATTQMQAAIRTDGGQRDTLISENLVYKCVSQGILLKLNNRCENNVIADIIAPPRGYYLSLREGPMTGATIRRNIFYSPGSECTFIHELPPGAGTVSEDRRGRKLAQASDADTDHNIYFCVADPRISEAMLAKQVGDGVDGNSLSTDPLFMDAENGDFRLHPDSPALQLGINSIDISNVGLVSTRIPSQ